MKKLLLLFVALLLIGSVSAFNTSNFKMYSPNDNSSTIGTWAVDSTGNNNNGTITGAVITGVTGLLNEAYEGTRTSGEEIDFGDSADFDCTSDGCSAGCWVMHDTDAFQPENIISKGTTSGGYALVDWKMQRSGVADTWQLRMTNGGSWPIDVSADVTDIEPGKWYHVIWTWDGTTAANKVKIYVNGSENASGTSSNSFSSITKDEDLTLIGDNSGAQNFELDGKIDECFFAQRELTSGEVSDLYNSGAGYNPFNITPPSNDSFWSINVKDLYNNTNLAGVTVIFDAGCSNTTNATGTATVTNSTPGCSGLGNPETIEIIRSGLHSNATIYSVAENTTGKAGMYNRIVDFMTVQSYITGDNVSLPYNITTDGGKTYVNASTIYTIPGLDNYTFSKTGWYNKTAVLSFGEIGSDIKNLTLTNAYNSKVTVNSKDAGGSLITNNILMNESYGAFEQSCTTTNGTCVFNLTQNLTYFFISDPINYSIKNTTLLVNSYAETINFIHQIERTFNLTIKDEITNEIINSTNFSIEIIGANSANNYTTSNGTLIVSLLTPDNYTIRYQGGQYPLRDYYETIGSESYFTISLYALTSGNATDTLVTVEDTTGDAVEGATVQLLRYYSDCNCYRIVEMGKTGYNGLTYLISQEATGFYKWLIEYDGTTQFISEEPERLIASTITGQITRTITIDLGSNYYESFIALTDLAETVTYNDATETLSFTWNDPSSIVTRGCIKAEYTLNARWVTFGETCANGTTGNVLLTLNNTNTTTFKWSAVVDTSSTFSSHTLDAGWINPTGNSLFGKVAAFSGLFIILGGAALFSFSAVAVIIWIAFSLIVFVGIQIAGIITILPFTLQVVTSFVALIIGVSLYLMRR